MWLTAIVVYDALIELSVSTNENELLHEKRRHLGSFTYQPLKNRAAY